MANHEQIEILQKGVGVWNKWREDNPNVNIDLIHANLGKVRLSETSLNGAYRQGINLIRADLQQANLQGASLGDANLRGANLTKAYLLGADLSDASLNEATLIKTVLSEANLEDVNLSNTSLEEADFTNACLVRAYLRRADLTRANLSGANLSYTNLTESVLIRATVNNAILRNADLSGANLSEAYIIGTDFTASRIGNTIFGNNDFSSAHGLETIKHEGPSTIGMATIRNSKGKMPFEFLRGCGFSDLEIESAKLAAPGLDPDQVTQIVSEIHRLYCDQTIQFYSCFISYSNQDHNFVQRLHNDLQNNGVRCWFAPEDLKIGDEFRSAIGKQIRARDKLLIILSKSSIHSEWVGDEVETALAEEKELGVQKLIPIRLDNAVFETKNDWAEKIRLRRQIGDFSGDYAQAFQRLLRDLRPQ